MTKPALEGKVALVTGAASGIGRATAERFVQEGAYVVGLDRNGRGMQETERFKPFACDVADHEALQEAVRMAAAPHGRMDILVNNAAFCAYERLGESSLENWRRTFAVNLESMYVLARLVVPHMAGYGRIVNISSTQSFSAEATVGAYAASKGGINAWSRALAVDLAPQGILVNVVAPGCIHTGMSVIGGVDETQTEEFQDWYVRRRKIPLARPGSPEEVANVILFLSGDQCSYLTGHVLVVDGGLTATF